MIGVFTYNIKRSAIGRLKKGFIKTGCRSIREQIVNKLFENNNIKREQIDKIYGGNVLSASLGQNIAR